jgi:hypothetical protein
MPLIYDYKENSNMNNNRNKNNRDIKTGSIGIRPNDINNNKTTKYTK